jgi:hypothetical protein
MPLSTANSARPKPQHSAGNLANEDPWVGHAADHDALAAATGGAYSAVFVVGAEGSNIINVGVQLVDAAGTDVAWPTVLEAFLSDDVAGLGISAAAPDGSVAIGTDGLIIVTHTTDLAWLLQSDATGHIDIDINDVTGTPTWYLVVVLPNGLVAVSAAITFA